MELTARGADAQRRSDLHLVMEIVGRQPRRHVALKLTRTDVLTPAAQARFLHEAEILGLLTRPDVARVYASGIEEVDGTPIAYIAVEHVQGAQDLVSYVQRSGFALSARLELFARLCDAVQHGHQKGVVHRDLKPANVLVDDSGHLKVIDFGIARFLDTEQGTNRLTLDGRVMGTLSHMSPEQCSSARDIDTRTDVYALGVLLYELATDRLPHDLSQAGLLEAARILQTEEPPRPSSLAPGIESDLDRIVAKAMSKDRELRYATAAALGRDVRALLSGDPVSAHPPSRAYLVRRFVGRNRTPVVLGSLLFLSLVAFSIYAQLEANRIRRERDRVSQEARKYERSTEFFASLLDSANPKTGTGSATLLGALDDLIPRIPELLGDEPEVEIHVRGLVCMKLRELGRYPAAEDQRRQALALVEELPAADLEERVTQRVLLAELLLERVALDEARALLSGARRLVREADSRHPLLQADVAAAEGTLAALGGETDRADELIEEARGLYTELGNVPGIIQSLSDLGSQAALREDWDSAIRLLSEAYSRAQGHYPPDDARRVFAGYYLTWYLWNRGSEQDVAQAERMQREMLAELRAIYGRETFYEVVWLRNLARYVYAPGRVEEALSVAEEALEMALRILPPQHSEIARTRSVYARLLKRTGRTEEARGQWTEALLIFRAAHGEDHFEVRGMQEELKAIEEPDAL